jgi:hypothetical protein
MVREPKCHGCSASLCDNDSVYLLTTAKYRRGMTEKAEFGWSSHFTPVREWCRTCGSKLWWNTHGQCPFCPDTLSDGAEVFCLVSGDLPPSGSISLASRLVGFVAHKGCFEKRHPDFSS